MKITVFPQNHGNPKWLPENALLHAIIEGVWKFMVNYVEENAIILPGRILSFISDDIKVLASSETKMSSWLVYQATCKVSDMRAVGYRKFFDHANDRSVSYLPTKHYTRRLQEL